MKKEVVFIVLVIVAIWALLSFSKVFNKATEEDARKFFQEDLLESYPDADVREILDVTRIGEGADSYYTLKARVSYNMSTPCPERTEVEYNYPSKNFAKRSVDAIVYGCQVCQNRPNCVISYPEEAIIASHTYEGTEGVKRYLVQNPQAKPKAMLLSDYDGQASVWRVDWTDGQGAGVRVYISQTRNALIGLETLDAPAPESA